MLDVDVSTSFSQWTFKLFPYKAVFVDEWWKQTQKWCALVSNIGLGKECKICNIALASTIHLLHTHFPCPLPLCCIDTTEVAYPYLVIHRGKKRTYPIDMESQFNVNSEKALHVRPSFFCKFSILEVIMSLSRLRWSRSWDPKQPPAKRLCNAH